MNSKPSSLKSTTTNESKRNNNVACKLRRLKIEENLLLQSLQKLDQKRDYEVCESDTNNDTDCENMIKNLKDSYTNIKNVFDDLKTVTSSQELLADLEIEEIKKKVLELETKMKSFKFHLSTELSTLRNIEQELTKQIEDIHFEEANIKKQAKISSSSLKQAVTSPVRIMMSSPLKCSEVQEFQDFMEKCPNRYGGWNEYHHNIFVKLWHKHFGNPTDTGDSDTFVKDLMLENFIEESLMKLQGVDKKSLISHIQWFKIYLLLKSKQKTAINKWKFKKSSMKKVNDKDVQALQNVAEKSIQQKYVEKRKKSDLTKQTPKTLSKEDFQRVMAPTKQWLSRCEDEQKREQIHFIEKVEKLRIPSWRKYL